MWLGLANSGSDGSPRTNRQCTEPLHSSCRPLHLFNPVRGQPTAHGLNSISAACMEEGVPQGTLFGLQATSQYVKRTLSQLPDALNSIGSGRMLTSVFTLNVLL